VHELRKYEWVLVKSRVGTGVLPVQAERSSAAFWEAYTCGLGCSQIALHIPMCNNLHMATNLALDDKLIEEARKAGHHRTKKDAVTAALAEYVKRRKQQRILEAFGSFEFDPAYDYKAERRRSR